MRLKTTLASIIGLCVRRAREKAGLTQGQLAAALGVTQSAYSKYEVGACDFSFRTALRLLAECECSLPDFYHELSAVRLALNTAGIVCDEDDSIKGVYLTTKQLEEALLTKTIGAEENAEDKDE